MQSLAEIFSNLSRSPLVQSPIEKIGQENSECMTNPPAFSLSEPATFTDCHQSRTISNETVPVTAMEALSPGLTLSDIHSGEAEFAGVQNDRVEKRANLLGPVVSDVVSVVDNEEKDELLLGRNQTLTELDLVGNMIGAIMYWCAHVQLFVLCRRSRS